MPGEQNVTDVVVAIAAQRLPHRGVFDAMSEGASNGSPMVAITSLPTAGMALPGVSDCVDSSETRRSEGDEQLRVMGHSVGNTVMTAVEAGVDQLPDIAGIQIRARRARQRAAVVAPREYVMLSAELIEGLQADWARAESGPFCGIPPCVETRR